jgi:D-3-phosphoglycerate dehydrogenase
MYKILISDKLGQAGLDRLKKAQDIQFDVKLGLEKEQLLSIIPAYDAIIVRSSTKVDRDVLEAGKNLRVIGRAGIGVDNIDIQAATSKGIIVMNTPQANAVATAEQAMAMMLAVSRNTAQAHASLLAGEWKRAEFTGTQLYRKTLGLIGFGRIGRLVAKRAIAFGMEVLAFDPFVSEEVARELGVVLVDLDDLLVQSDYISLHTIITPETEYIINDKSLGKMKRGVVIINSARGKLINEAALVAALQSGQVGAAAIDVFSEEPPINNPLIGMNRVLHTPHLGASTTEAQRDVATRIVDQVIDALRGVDFKNTVNMPFQAGPDFATLRPHMELAEKIGVLQAAMAPSPIRRVEIEVSGDLVDRLVRPAAAALLKGLLENSLSDPVNYVSAPFIAEENGISISQTTGISLIDYPNLISSQVYWKTGKRLIAGVLFAGSAPRIVQVEDYHLDANPEGIILILRNRDVPGVIGQVGTVLGKDDVNIGEWRMGRHKPGGEALSFISLDNRPSGEALHSLEKIPAITNVKLVKL